jgi:hypothetical protein
MPHGKMLTEIERGQILGMARMDASVAEIAKAINRSRKVVSNFLSDTENYGKNHAGGRERSLSDRDKRQIIRYVSNNHASARKVQVELGLTASLTVIRELLRSTDYIKYMKMQSKPKLQEHHKVARVEWASEQINLARQWHTVVFSDEKKWNLDGPDRLACYWRDLRNDETFRSRRVHGGGSVMVWACFGWGTGLRVAFVSSKMNTNDYQEVLESELVPYGADLGGPDWIFQQDNAPIHSAAVNRGWFAERNIRVLPWPSLSPDMNPMENAWGMLVRLTYAEGKQYDSVEALRDGILHSAAKIQVTDLQNLIKSMPNRLIELLQQRGSWTHY